MKKAILFSMSTGGGHNKAANNLKDLLLDQGYEVVISDAMKEISPTLDHMVTEGYESLANKAPTTYGRLYRMTNSKKTSRILDKYLSRISKNRILNIIKRENPDIIFGTHPFVVSFITLLKDNHLLDLPFISIVTDFEAHHIYLSKAVDAYIVGSPYTREKMIASNIDPHKIFLYGIPVSNKFQTRKTTPSDTEFNLLVMAGALGFNYITGLVNELLKIKEPIVIRAICGKNKKTKDKMEYLFRKHIETGKLKLYAYVDNVDEFMDKSHCIVTKPGGLTITESICKNLPLIIPFYVPGQEKENTDFLTYNSLAFCSKNSKDTRFLVEKMISFPSLLEDIRRNMKFLSDHYANEKIVALADELISKRISIKNN